MAAVTLPQLPRSALLVIREINRDRALQPTFGGDESLIQRLGTKHEIAIGIPAISSALCGPAFVALLAKGKSAGALVTIPEPKVNQVGYGTPLVNGASQQGSSLAIDGLTPGAVIPAGKWLTVTVGRRYAHFTTAEVTANGSGQAVLPIYPMIRRSPADNAVVVLSEPKLEGRVQMDEREVRRIGALSFNFTVREWG